MQLWQRRQHVECCDQFRFVGGQGHPLCCEVPAVETLSRGRLTGDLLCPIKIVESVDDAVTVEIAVVTALTAAAGSVGEYMLCPNRVVARVNGAVEVGVGLSRYKRNF